MESLEESRIVQSGPEMSPRCFWICLSTECGCHLDSIQPHISPFKKEGRERLSREWIGKLSMYQHTHARIRAKTNSTLVITLCVWNGSLRGIHSCGSHLFFLTAAAAQGITLKGQYVYFVTTGRRDTTRWCYEMTVSQPSRDIYTPTVLIIYFVLIGN